MQDVSNVLSPCRMCLTSYRHAGCTPGTDRFRQVHVRWKLQIKPAISPSHGNLTLGQSVPALILKPQASGRVTSKQSSLRSTNLKFTGIGTGFQPESPVLEEDALPSDDRAVRKAGRQTGCMDLTTLSKFQVQEVWTCQPLQSFKFNLTSVSKHSIRVQFGL